MVAVPRECRYSLQSFVITLHNGPCFLYCQKLFVSVRKGPLCYGDILHGEQSCRDRLETHKVYEKVSEKERGGAFTHLATTTTKLKKKTRYIYQVVVPRHPDITVVH